MYDGKQLLFETPRKGMFQREALYLFATIDDDTTHFELSGECFFAPALKRLSVNKLALMFQAMLRNLNVECIKMLVKKFLLNLFTLCSPRLIRLN